MFRSIRTQPPALHTPIFIDPPLESKLAPTYRCIFQIACDLPHASQPFPAGTCRLHSFGGTQRAPDYQNTHHKTHTKHTHPLCVGVHPEPLDRPCAARAWCSQPCTQRRTRYPY